AYDYLAYNDVNKGIERVIANFNGFEVSENRNDSGKLVLDYYKRQLDTIELFGGTIGYEIDSWKLAFILQFIMSQYLCPLDELAKTYDIEEILLTSEMLQDRFIELQSHVYSTTLNSLKEKLGYNNISRSMYDYKVVSICTNRGYHVTAFDINCFDPDYDIEYGRRYIAENYPNVEIIGDATCRYNCHSFTWDILYGGNRYWINQIYNGKENLSNYWNDGSYEITDVKHAIKAFDPVEDHSAKVIDANTYISKWGKLPLIKHKLEDSPYWENSSENILYFKYGNPPIIEGKVIWDMFPDPSIVNVEEDFGINTTYDSVVFDTEVFVSTQERPDESVDNDIVKIVIKSPTSATITFKETGIYFVNFKIYEKATRRVYALYMSNEIYVSYPHKYNNEEEIENEEI
ncbi:MAG: hypothetical protein NC207_08485, partial [Bacteroides sp.]|nr:hypothetical protein [Bacteroides sp.]